MNTVQLRDAKAKLSALIDAAERGEVTTITKHGKPAAMIVPMGVGLGAEPQDDAWNLIEHLLTMPDDIPLERDPSPVRPIEL